MAPGMKVFLFIAALAGLGSSAGATEQIPDKIVIDGSGEQDLLGYPIEAIPIKLPIHDPEVRDRVRETLDHPPCTALWRGYQAKWEIKNSALYLTEVRMGRCGDVVIPLTAWFPDSTGPVLATWMSGPLTVWFRDPSKSDFASKLNQYAAIYQVDKGKVGPCLPNEDFRPCKFDFCVGGRTGFSENSVDFTPQAGEQLIRWAMWLKRFPRDMVQIEGHADDRETDPGRLSALRAKKGPRLSG